MWTILKRLTLNQEAGFKTFLPCKLEKVTNQNITVARMHHCHIQFVILCREDKDYVQCYSSLIKECKEYLLLRILGDF